MQDKINPRNAAELGLPELGNQLPHGGIGHADWLGMDEDAHGWQGHGGLAVGGGGFGI